MTQAMRAVDWDGMTGAEIVARIRAADGQPGLRDGIEGHEVWLHDAHPAATRRPTLRGPATSSGRPMRRSCAGRGWRGLDRPSLHPPAGGATPEAARDACARDPGPRPAPRAFRAGRAQPRQHGKARRRGRDPLPLLNGAMSVARSHALATAIRDARDAKVILLTGGPEFWCNGIDLATIEAADSPAEESLAAIEAIDDVCLALLETTGSLDHRRDGRECWRGRCLHGAGRRSGRGAGGHGSQPALQEHGQSLWLRILDLHPAPSPRAGGRRAADGNPHADPGAGGREDRAGG
jgi:putative two-component system hydrogenase maturation factor HypX/HoxX